MANWASFFLPHMFLLSPTLRCGLTSIGYGLPHFGVPPLSCRYGLARLGVATQAGEMDPLYSVWPFDFEICVTFLVESMDSQTLVCPFAFEGW